MKDTGKKPGLLERLVTRIPSNFGRTRPEIHYWLFTPVLLGQLLWVADSRQVSFALGAALFAAGIFAWTLLEYFLHRFSFHSKSEHPLIRPFNSGLHKLHHAAPASILYVGAPIIMAIPVYGMTLTVFRLLSGNWVYALTIGSGLAFSFLFYEFTHYTAHQRQPKTRYMKYLKKHHMRHHFAEEQKLFGVTSPLWDYIFGTQVPLAKFKRPPRAVGSSSNSAAS